MRHQRCGWSLPGRLAFFIEHYSTYLSTSVTVIFCYTLYYHVLSPVSTEIHSLSSYVVNM